MFEDHTWPHGQSCDANPRPSWSFDLNDTTPSKNENAAMVLDDIPSSHPIEFPTATQVLSNIRNTEIGLPPSHARLARTSAQHHCPYTLTTSSRFADIAAPPDRAETASGANICYATTLPFSRPDSLLSLQYAHLGRGERSRAVAVN